MSWPIIVLPCFSNHSLPWPSAGYLAGRSVGRPAGHNTFPLLACVRPRILKPSRSPFLLFPFFFLLLWLTMPPVRNSKPTSSERRRTLGIFINRFGDTMPRACSSCRRKNVECKVHIRSGRCGACHLSGIVCDIRVTQSEWDRLKSERARLLSEIEEARRAQQSAREAQEAAHRAHILAFKAMDKAFDNEVALRKEMSALEVEAEAAIAVEEANIAKLEEQEEASVAPVAHQGGLALSPFTWSACDGLPDQFWGSSPSIPWVLTGSEFPPSS